MSYISPLQSTVIRTGIGKTHYGLFQLTPAIHRKDQQAAVGVYRHHQFSDIVSLKSIPVDLWYSHTPLGIDT